MTLRVLDSMLAEPSKTGKVLVLAGGGGSGKSTVYPTLDSDADFVYDTTLSNPAAAGKLFEKIKSSGRTVEVAYVHSDFSKAFTNVIDRYLKPKHGQPPRIVPLNIAATAHIGAQEVLFNLKDIPVTVYDNTGPVGQISEISLDKFDTLRYIQLNKSHDSDEHFNQPRETETGGAGGSATAGEAGRDQGRAGAKARLEEAGRAIVESYRERGLLTDAESHAFLGRNSFAASPSIVVPGKVSGSERDVRGPGAVFLKITGQPAADDGGRSLRPTAEQRLEPRRELASGKKLAHWAGQKGRILSPEAILSSNADTGVGDGEHLPIYDKPSNRMVKVTDRGTFGGQGKDAGAYLRRWELHNKLFGTGVTFEGIVTLPGEQEPRAVISQPSVKGRDATESEQADFLAGKGYRRIASGRWVHPMLGVAVWGTHPGDAIMTEGGVVPINYQIEFATTEEMAEIKN